MSAIHEPLPSVSNDAELVTEILEKTISFPLGLPGFPEARRFILSQTEDERPFAWLRCLDQSYLAFAVVEAFRLVPDYTVEIADDDLAAIGSPAPQECAVLLILRVEIGKTVKIHANLRAPLILNMTTREARQVILAEADNYSESTLFEFGVKK